MSEAKNKIRSANQSLGPTKKNKLIEVWCKNTYIRYQHVPNLSSLSAEYANGTGCMSNFIHKRY